MRIVLQRVSQASVSVGEETIAAIGTGLLLLVAVEVGDDLPEILDMADKVTRLRVFEDGAGKMNLDVDQADGELLVVSQFTLAASTRKGRRPSFNGAAPPTVATELLAAFVERLRDSGVAVVEGRFGAKMAVKLVNDGPVTLVLDTRPETAG